MVEDTRKLGTVKVLMLTPTGGGGDTHGIPSGGTSGQVLTKSGDADYAVIWSTLKRARAVELSETNIQTEVGTAKTVTVKYRVAGSGDTATYTSSDTSVATVAVTGHSTTGTSATDVITITPVANGDCTIKAAFANEVGYDAEYDYINVTVGAASGGSSIKKTRYAVNASSWSASANSDGYYTYTQTLSPACKSSPDVYVAGSTDSTQATDAQRTQFGYVERCKVNGSTLTLYAKTKPTANFYIWVEGEEGTASGDIAGNVVKPNGGVFYSTSEFFTGKYWIDGRPIYGRVVDTGALPNATSKTVATGIPEVTLIDYHGIAYNPTGGMTILLPSVHKASSYNVSLTVAYNAANIYLECNEDRSNYTSSYVTVEYVK